VRAKNQDLLMTISELKDKIKTIEKGKDVNTKFDKSATLGKLLCVTSLNKDKAVKAKKVSKTEDKIDKLKPVTSHSTPKNEQILLNTKSKSTSTNVKKFSSSVSVVSNKRETLNSTICQSNSIVLKAKTVNVVNDGLNLVCVSCGIDVFMISHDKYVARYALSVDSKVKRALFTSPTAAKSRNLRATSVVAKSRFSVAKTLTTTNKVSSASSISTESSQRSTLSNYMKNKIATSGKWQNGLKINQVLIGHPRVIQLILWIVDSECSKHMTAITGYGDYVKGNLTICHVYYVEGLGHNLFSGEDLLTDSRKSNLYTISISELAAFSLVFLMSKATSTKSWLWHQRLSHLNFGTINQLTKKDLVDGLPKFKYDKDHLCSACEQGKSKKATFLLIVL
ncbi:retrovirus-related pol polyprotein from transposon TNT 1-94, partial [Tanacetum coccineum]